MYVHLCVYVDYAQVQNDCLRISDKKAVFKTVVSEYLAAEILELATNAPRDEGRLRIQPRYVILY